MSILESIKNCPRFQNYQKNHVSTREAAKACLRDLSEIKERPCWKNDISVVLPSLDEIVQAMGGKVLQDEGQMGLFE